MRFLSLKKRQAVLGVYNRTPKFKSVQEAEEFYFGLKDAALTWINDFNPTVDNKLDFSADSLIFLRDFYLQCNKSGEFKKRLGINKDDFRLIFGIYHFEVYAKNKLAIWTVEQFFESDAYTFGINTTIVANYRNHILPEIENGECLNFYERYLICTKPVIKNINISDDLRNILNESSNTEITEDFSNKGFEYRKTIKLRVKEKFNKELLSFIEEENDFDLILNAMFFIREQLNKYYDYQLINAIIKKVEFCKVPMTVYFILGYLDEIRKCKNVDHEVFFKYAKMRSTFKREVGIENLGTFKEKQNTILSLSESLLNDDKRENIREDVIRAIGNLGDQRGIILLEPYTKVRKLKWRHTSQYAIEQITTKNS